MKSKNKFKNCDLHLHTKASDGTDSVEKTIKIARERGLDCVAITDHDVLHKELGFRSKEIKGLEVINACEIKAEIGGIKIEILGYFLDTSDPQLQELIERIEENRNQRMKKMAEKVNSAVESDITMEDVKKVSSGSLARPNLARVLVNKKVVSSVSEAFQKYIRKGGPCYVAQEKLKAGEVIQTVHENGGVTSLSHPGRNLPKERAEKLVSELKEFGLDALEVEYPYKLISEANSEEMNFGREKSGELAKKFDLLKTGGSDSHGTKSDKDFIGEIKIPYSRVKSLKELRT